MVGYLAKSSYVTGDFLTLTLRRSLQFVPQVLAVVDIEKPISKLVLEIAICRRLMLQGAKPTSRRALKYTRERTDNIITRYIRTLYAISEPCEELLWFFLLVACGLQAPSAEVLDSNGFRRRAAATCSLRCACTIYTQRAFTTPLPRTVTSTF